MNILKINNNEIYVFILEGCEDVLICNNHDHSLSGMTINIASSYYYLRTLKSQLQARKFTIHEKCLQNKEDSFFIMGKQQTTDVVTQVFATTYSGKIHLSWRLIDKTNEK